MLAVPSVVPYVVPSVVPQVVPSVGYYTLGVQISALEAPGAHDLRRPRWSGSPGTSRATCDAAIL
jgi:hypothetical protein